MHGNITTCWRLTFVRNNLSSLKTLVKSTKSDKRITHLSLDHSVEKWSDDFPVSLSRRSRRDSSAVSVGNGTGWPSCPGRVSSIEERKVVTSSITQMETEVLKGHQSMVRWHRGTDHLTYILRDSSWRLRRERIDSTSPSIREREVRSLLSVSCWQRFLWKDCLRENWENIGVILPLKLVDESLKTYHLIT